MTMLTSWKLDPYTVMRLNSGRRGDDVVKGGGGDIWRAVAINHLQAPTLLSLTLHASQDQGFRIVYPAKYYFESFPLYRLN